jgi:hypothetical protein
MTDKGHVRACAMVWIVQGEWIVAIAKAQASRFSRESSRQRPRAVSSSLD